MKENEDDLFAYAAEVGTRMRYRNYITWKRLTHNGRRTREQMTPESQAEWDALGVKEVPPLTADEKAEAKRLYEEVTLRSVPGSASPT